MPKIQAKPKKRNPRDPCATTLKTIARAMKRARP